jgi:hypothetical protein
MKLLTLSNKELAIIHQWNYAHNNELPSTPDQDKLSLKLFNTIPNKHTNNQTIQPLVNPNLPDSIDFNDLNQILTDCLDPSEPSLQAITITTNLIQELNTQIAYTKLTSSSKYIIISTIYNFLLQQLNNGYLNPNKMTNEYIYELSTSLTNYIINLNKQP